MSAIRAILLTGAIFASTPIATRSGPPAVSFAGDSVGECMVWEERAPSAVVPDARNAHAMAYDSARGVTVLFGGRYCTGYITTTHCVQYGDTWEWDGESWSLRTLEGPSPREAHAMVFDSARGLTVLFGGRECEGETLRDCVDRGDTWEWDGAVWTLRSEEGPSPRAHLGMAYDVHRGVAVALGGRSWPESGSGSWTVHGDTWEWDGAAWMLRDTTGLPPRYDHAVAYDGARDVTLVFGGMAFDSLFGYFRETDDTWEWDGSTWTLHSVPGPSARFASAMAHDSARGVTVLFGGLYWTGYSDGSNGDTWEWDGSAWNLVSDDGVAPRGRHAMAYDSARGEIVRFGGIYTCPEALPCISFQGTWEWDGAGWTGGPGVAPLSRAGHGMAYDVARGVSVVFGGYDDTVWGALGDTWEWDGANWKLAAETGPSAGSYRAMVYDTERSVTILFGAGSTTDETWQWDGTVWTQRVIPPESTPPPRSGHAMAYDTLRNVTVMFGGSGSHFGTRRDTWEWDGAGWAQRSDTGPSRRKWHAMAFDSVRGVTVLFGGYGYAGVSLGDTWEWDGATWTHRSDTGPSPRDGVSMTYDLTREVTVLFGGWYDETGETWEWDGEVWTFREVTGPSSRCDHTMIHDSQRGGVLLFGGEEWEYPTDTSGLWTYWCADECTAPPAAPAGEVHTPCGQSCYATKNRYLSIIPPPVPPAALGLALRVTLDTMPGPDDCPGVPDYSAFDGTEMWVGDELLAGDETPTGVFGLQSTPHFRDWTTVEGGVVQVSDCNIVPCATYRIEAIRDEACGLAEPFEFSPSLVLQTTTVWGDITGLNNIDPADGDLNVLDVAATVDCLKDTPNAPPTTWGDVFIHTPSTGDAVGMSVLDVATVVDALKEYDYPFSGPTAPDPCDGPG